MTLSTSSNFTKPDDAFRAVVEAHRGLSDEQSADLDAAISACCARRSRWRSGGWRMRISNSSNSSSNRINMLQYVIATRWSSQ
jgi:hypothetical protein